ncbi:hypothetical protein ES705_25196 [subsurface metagenome]
MQYLKRNTKYSILAFLVIVLSITTIISPLTKTEVYLSLYDNPQILYTTSLKPEIQTININIESQDELIKILKISEPLAQKIIGLSFMSFPLPSLSFPRKRESIILRGELGGFKEPKDLLQLPEITNLEWEEWKEEGIIIITQ